MWTSNFSSCQNGIAGKNISKINSIEVIEISKRMDCLQRALAHTRGQLETSKSELKAELAALNKKLDYLVTRQGEK